MAASNWASPPYARAKPSHARPVAWVIQPAFIGGQQERGEGKGGQPERGRIGDAQAGGGVVGVEWTVRSSLTLNFDPSW